MTVEPCFSNDGIHFELIKAILIYSRKNAFRGDGGMGSPANLLCSIHDVRVDAREGQEHLNRPVVGPGSLLKRSVLETMLRDMASGKREECQILPERLLFGDMTQLVWWSPARRETIYFSTADKGFDADVTGKVVAHPPLIFTATAQGIRVFALSESRRPQMATPVFVAPYCNLYNDGTMCRGDVQLPDVLEPSLIEKWERAFFDSRFTHTNLHDGIKPTSHPDGHNGLWRAMRGRKVFDVKYLTPTKGTVGNVLNREWS